jgi:hypothetical protein
MNGSERGSSLLLRPAIPTGLRQQILMLAHVKGFLHAGS